MSAKKAMTTGSSRRAKKPSPHDKDFRELVKSVAALAEQSRGLARLATGELAPEVETVIATRCQSKIRIEHLLDRLLDFSFDPDVLAIFRKLCRYYYAIDPAATVYYVQSYREMWDEELLPKRQRRRLGWSRKRIVVGEEGK